MKRLIYEEVYFELVTLQVVDDGVYVRVEDDHHQKGPFIGEQNERKADQNRPPETMTEQAHLPVDPVDRFLNVLHLPRPPPFLFQVAETAVNLKREVGDEMQQEHD